MSYRIFFVFSCFLFFISTALTLLEVKYLKPQFLDFVQLHEKVYSSDKEHNYRFNVFMNNLKKAELLQKESQGTAKYGVTQFSDLTDKEFKKHHLGLSVKTLNQKNFKTAKIPKIRLPKHFDWRKKHVVTEVKSQDVCASCWAFATTGNIESLYAIKHKKLISLSEQGKIIFVHVFLQYITNLFYLNVLGVNSIVLTL
uniref:Cathepsin propeptide inhibitor domain-containing protein n=1 Tax=Clastoptera arizonana TaxID=38151 RepID=A0A1B6CLQ5_9HEMI